MMENTKFRPINMRNLLKELPKKELLKLSLFIYEDNMVKRKSLIETDTQKLSKAYAMGDILELYGVKTEEELIAQVMVFLAGDGITGENIAQEIANLLVCEVKKEKDSNQEAKKLLALYFFQLFNIRKSSLSNLCGRLVDFGNDQILEILNKHNDYEGVLEKELTRWIEEIETAYKKCYEVDIMYVETICALAMLKHGFAEITKGSISVKIETGESELSLLEERVNESHIEEVLEAEKARFNAYMRLRFIPLVMHTFKEKADKLLETREVALLKEEIEKVKTTMRRMETELKRKEEEKEKNEKTIVTLRAQVKELTQNAKESEKAPKVEPIAVVKQETEMELREAKILLMEEKRQKELAMRDAESLEALYQKVSTDLNNCSAELGNLKRKLIALNSRAHVEMVLEDFYQEHGMSEPLEILLLSILEREYVEKKKAFTSYTKSFLLKLEGKIEREMNMKYFSATTLVATSAPVIAEKEVPDGSIGYLTYIEEEAYIVFNEQKKVKAKNNNESYVPEGTFVRANPTGEIIYRFKCLYGKHRVVKGEKFAVLEDRGDKWRVYISKDEAFVLDKNKVSKKAKEAQAVAINEQGEITFFYNNFVPYVEHYDVPLKHRNETPYFVLRLFSENLVLVRNIYTNEESVKEITKKEGLTFNIRERIVLFLNEENVVQLGLFSIRSYTFSSYYEQKQKGIVEYFNGLPMIRLFNGTVQALAYVPESVPLVDEDVIVVDEFWQYMYHSLSEQTVGESDETKKLSYRKSVKRLETKEAEEKVALTSEVVIVGRPSFRTSYETAFAKIGVKVILMDGYGSAEAINREVKADHCVILIPSFVSHSNMWTLKDNMKKGKLMFAKGEGASHLVELYQENLLMAGI